MGEAGGVGGAGGTVEGEVVAVEGAGTVVACGTVDVDVDGVEELVIEVEVV